MVSNSTNNNIKNTKTKNDHLSTLITYLLWKCMASPLQIIGSNYHGGMNIGI